MATVLRFAFKTNRIASKRYLSAQERWKINGIHMQNSLASSYVSFHGNYFRDYESKYSSDLHRLTSTTTNLYPIRNFSLSSIRYESEPLKPSSKVEESVNALKMKQEETKLKLETEAKSKQEPSASTVETVKKEPVKKSLKQKIKDELLHYYHGFRLLFIDINISRKLIGRILNGKTLTRREHKLLVRTTGDVFRLIPFSVFIIVPFMEFLLPVAIKLFPGMLPSTFETNTEKEDKMRQSLKVKLEMAKFLQQTLDEMAPQSKDKKQSELAREFSEFCNKLKSSGEQPTKEDIMRFSKLFEDEITLDSLARPQLVALCRVLESNVIGTSVILRFHLRMKLRSLAADDKLIAKEGIESMTLGELQQACRARGMRAYGMPEDRLRSQLQSWLDLSLNEKVPPTLLLLSRALMIPESVPTTDKLKASISILPENVVVAQKAAISEKEGKVDHKAKIEAIKEEERRIQEERQEQKEELARIQKEEIVDKAPIVDAQATTEIIDKAPIISAATDKPIEPKKEEEISAKDIEIIEDALDSLGKSKKKMLVEKEELQDLKEEMAEYQEDVQELKKISQDNIEKLQVTKGAKRLFNKVNSMISKMEVALANVEKEKSKQLENSETEELVHIDELMEAIKKIRNIPDDSKMTQIQLILGRLDDDFDGQLKVDDVVKVIEVIGKENVKLSQKQMGELIELLDREEIIDVEHKIQKALQKEIDQEKIENGVEESKLELQTEADTKINGGENLLKEAEKQEELKKATDRTKENIIPKIDIDEIKTQPPTNDTIKKKDIGNGTSKTL